MSHSNKCIIYTDGSARGNPGNGGWGFRYESLSGIAEFGGREDYTTNNRMEMIALIEALTFFLDHPEDVLELRIDSKYVIDGTTAWMPNWKKNNWKRKPSGEVLNRDLWERIDVLYEKTRARAQVIFTYVKGHSGERGNDRVDTIATSYADNVPVPLQNDFQK